MQFLGNGADLVARAAPLNGQLPGLPRERFPWSCITLGLQPSTRGQVPDVLSLALGPGANLSARPCFYPHS